MLTWGQSVAMRAVALTAAWVLSIYYLGWMGILAAFGIGAVIALIPMPARGR